MAAPMRRSILACSTLKNYLFSGRHLQPISIKARSLTTQGDDDTKDHEPKKAIHKEQSFKEMFIQAQKAERDVGQTQKAEPDVEQIFQRLTKDVEIMRKDKQAKEKLGETTEMPQEPEKRRKKVHVAPCRTKESNPANHTLDHCGLFYTVPKVDADKWLYNVFHREYYKTVKAFREMGVMVREPALEVLNYLKIADYNMPAIRYLLFGHNGAGKSHTMGHVMHYCGTQGWMILHVRWSAQWNRYPEEIVPSSHNTERFDTPREGAEWLVHFKYMNEDLIKSLDLRCQNRYMWSKRESTEVGDSWLEAIDFALSRPKYSCDVVGMILKEAKLNACQGKLKLLVAIDGANSFFVNTVFKRDVTNKRIHATDLSLNHNFKKLTKNDWTGGAVLITIDDRAGDLDLKDSYLPKYLLQTGDGYEHFDPHIPVHVPHYSDKEIHSCLNYYIENKWIQNPVAHTDAGKKELMFTSCKNPLALYKATRAW